MKKPTKEQAKTIRIIAKAHGIKGCKLTLGRVAVGKQCKWLEASVVYAFNADLMRAGFHIEPMFLEGINRGLCDTFLIYAK